MVDFSYFCSGAHPTGGLSEFGVLHPSLCEVSVSSLQRAPSVGLRATTPGRSPHGQLQPELLGGAGGKDGESERWER